MKKSVIIILLVVILTVFCVPISAEAHDYMRPPKNILVVFSYSPSYPSSDLLLDGLRSAFSEENVHLQVEYMDTKLLDPDATEEFFLNLLQKKIDLLGHIDLVITFDDNALVFINKHYEDLFGASSSGSIPVVFSGCNDYATTEAIYASMNNITGDLEPSSRIKTLDIATKLIPDYNSITILVDNTITAQGLKAQLVSENENNYPLTFINSEDYTYSELSDILAKLTPKDIFLFVACFEDSAGMRMTYTQSANFVYTILRTPIFCTTNYNVDAIFAEGYVHNKTQSGYDTGLVAKSIIYDGISAESIGLNRDKDANMSYMFNVDILSSYGISTSAIPVEALRIHRSSVDIFSESGLSLDQKLILLIIFLGLSVIIVSGFALFRHNKAIQHERIALTDPLTGIGSRIALDTKLDVLINYCQQNNASATLVFLDIDGFKTINDHYGHTMGDSILKQVVERIQSVISKKCDIYRYGGDEFIILLRMPAKEAKGEIKCIVKAFDLPIINGKESVSVNLSMGAVEMPNDGTDAITLISKADTAMYAAKTFNATRAIFYGNLH